MSIPIPKSLLLLLLATGFSTMATADDNLAEIEMTGNFTISGNGFLLPRVTYKQGREARITYPIEREGKSYDLVVSAEAVIENKSINYKISAEIPLGGGKTSKLSATGTSDDGTPVVYEFDNGGSHYRLAVLLFQRAHAKK